MPHALCALRAFGRANFFTDDTKYDDDSHYDFVNV